MSRGTASAATYPDGRVSRLLVNASGLRATRRRESIQVPWLRILEVAGIQVGDTVRTPFSPAIPKPSTGILLLHQGHDGRQVLTVLGDTESSLQSVVELLRSGRFRSGLVSDLIRVFQFE